MSKLDDLLGKKKEIVPVLDLSKTIAHTKEEYKRLQERIPDYKMRPIKVQYGISRKCLIKFYRFHRCEAMKLK